MPPPVLFGNTPVIGDPEPLAPPAPDPLTEIDSQIAATEKHLNDVVNAGYNPIFPGANHRNAVLAEQLQNNLRYLTLKREYVANEPIRRAQREIQMKMVGPGGPGILVEGGKIVKSGAGYGSPVFSPEGKAGMVMYGPGDPSELYPKLGNQLYAIPGAPGMPPATGPGGSPFPTKVAEAPEVLSKEAAVVIPPVLGQPGSDYRMIQNTPLLTEVHPGSELFMPKGASAGLESTSVPEVKTITPGGAAIGFQGGRPMPETSVRVPKEGGKKDAADKIPDHLKDVVKSLVAGQPLGALANKAAVQIGGPDWRQVMAADPQGWTAKVKAWAMGQPPAQGAGKWKTTPGGVRYKPAGG